MSKLISNKFGIVDLRQDAGGQPVFIYTFVDDNGETDDCEYAFVFKDNEIHLFGWHCGHDIDFHYQGNWMDNEGVADGFHNHDYQDGLVGQLRLCLKDALNNIVGLAIEYL